MTPSPDGRPIFLEIADQIAADILVGAYPEQAQVPSTNELSVHYRVNPATAGKAFADEYVRPFLAEGRRLGLSLGEITDLIHKEDR